jgi:hypothetical protein
MLRSDQPARIGVSNNTDRLRIVWVEPIPEDYTLLARESLEVVVHDRSETPWFHVVEWEYSSQVYIEGVNLERFLEGIVSVFQNGKRLEPGHQRNKGLEAGLRY